ENGKSAGGVNPALARGPRPREVAVLADIGDPCRFAGAECSARKADAGREHAFFRDPGGGRRDKRGGAMPDPCRAQQRSLRRVLDVINMADVPADEAADLDD